MRSLHAHDGTRDKQSDPPGDGRMGEPGVTTSHLLTLRPSAAPSSVGSSGAQLRVGTTTLGNEPHMAVFRLSGGGRRLSGKTRQVNLVHPGTSHPSGVTPGNLIARHAGGVRALQG